MYNYTDFHSDCQLDFQKDMLINVNYNKFKIL